MSVENVENVVEPSARSINLESLRALAAAAVSIKLFMHMYTARANALINCLWVQ